MDKQFFNYNCLKKWCGFVKESQKALLLHYKKVEWINWHEVAKQKKLYGIESKLVLPFEEQPCRYVKAYHDALNWQQGLGVKYFFPSDKGFPLAFKQGDVKCDVLYSRGNHTLVMASKKVAIVGSRKPTPYGKRVAQELGQYLAKHHICVISGMALGVDAIAHYATLECGGNTIAVLASGVTNPYPKTNFNLYKRIVKENGLILSEKADYEVPQKYDFPLRNRLIGALADVVVVIEAAEKSGTMTTAYHAMNQGKTLYALPGNIYSEHSKGCNRLISEGAYPLIDFDDVLLTFGISPNPSETPIKQVIPDKILTLSETSQKIYTLLIQEGRIGLEEVKRVEKCEDSEVLAAFSELVYEELCQYISLNEIEIL